MHHKIITLIITALLLSLNQASAAHYDVSWDGGGNGHSWGDKDNWNPDIVPRNSASNTFDVSISNSHVVLDDYYDVNVSSLSIDGDVDLWSRFVQVFFIEHSSLSIGANDRIELNDLHVVPNGAVLNYGRIDFQHRSMIKEDIVNYGHINISAISEAGIEGELTNHGTVEISPISHFNANEGIQNHAQFGIHGGLGATDDAMNNNPTGILKGFGVFYAEQQIVNAGQIVAWGGSLTVATGGALTNTGLIQSTELSPLLISPYMSSTPGDFHNSGTIDIRTGGGAAFDCNLINDPGATIRFDGGTLAADNIQQMVDANLVGFGQISGNLLIGPAGIDSSAIVKLTGPTNIVGDVNIMAGNKLEISDGITLITGHTTCNNGTIHMVGGRVICQGGLTNNNCNIVWEPGLYINMADFNLDGKMNFEDFAYFADVWLWQAKL